jgi:hypothetical protein
MLTLFSFSCSSPSIVGTVDSCVTSNKFQEAECGKRILDYKQPKVKVGEWEDENKLQVVHLTDLPDSVCFTLSDYLVRIKPKLKEGSDAYHNSQGIK